MKHRVMYWERGWLSVTVRVDDDALVGAGIENRVNILCAEQIRRSGSTRHSGRWTVVRVEPRELSSFGRRRFAQSIQPKSA